jgi:hypothetical protein
MDSILKNVGREYVAEFQKNLMNHFMDVYRNVETEDQVKLKVRKDL